LENFARLDNEMGEIPIDVTMRSGNEQQKSNINTNSGNGMDTCRRGIVAALNPNSMLVVFIDKVDSAFGSLSTLLLSPEIVLGWNLEEEISSVSSPSSHWVAVFTACSSSKFSPNVNESKDVWSKSSQHVCPSTISITQSEFYKTLLPKNILGHESESIMMSSRTPKAYLIF
jgi:hypothetical protein